MSFLIIGGKMEQFVYLKNVVTLELREDQCIGCGVCLEVCPHEVLDMNGDCVQIRDRDACMECGACSRNCPVGAITVEAGVGCAAAIINGILGRKGDDCCCYIESKGV
jgi:ferredoxin